MHPVDNITINPEVANMGKDHTGFRILKVVSPSCSDLFRPKSDVVERCTVTVTPDCLALDRYVSFICPIRIEDKLYPVSGLVIGWSRR